MSHSSLPPRLERLETRLTTAIDTVDLLFSKNAVKNARNLRETYALTALPLTLQSSIEGDPAAIDAEMAKITPAQVRTNIQMAFQQIKMEINTQWFFRQIKDSLPPQHALIPDLNDDISLSQERVDHIVNDAQKQHEFLGEKTLSPVIEAERIDIANKLDVEKSPTPILNRQFTVTANVLRAKGDICHYHLNTAAHHLNNLDVSIRLYILMLAQPETRPQPDDSQLLHSVMDQHALRSTIALVHANQTLPQNDIKLALAPLKAKTNLPLQIH